MTELVKPSKWEITNARNMDGMLMEPNSHLWPKVANYQRLGLIRLRWLEHKVAELRFVEPVQPDAS